MWCVSGSAARKVERAVYDRMAELDGRHWWFTARRRILAEIVERVVRPPKDARILELGCGTGHNLEMLSRNSGNIGRMLLYMLQDVAPYVFPPCAHPDHLEFFRRLLSIIRSYIVNKAR